MLKIKGREWAATSGPAKQRQLGAGLAAQDLCKPMPMWSRCISVVTISWVFAFVLATTASATGQSSRPTLRATHPIAIEGSAAVLLGSVDPHGLNTVWYFEIGMTRAYGLQYPRSSFEDPLDGYGANAVEEAVECLAPMTTYHFRLVARNKAGKTAGPDHVLKTKQLLGSPKTLYGICPGHKPLK